MPGRAEQAIIEQTVMKFERQIEEDTRLGITPLIDIVFLLLIFLVTTSHFDQAVGITVTLPKTQSSNYNAASKRNIIVIDKDGLLYHNGAVLSEKGLPDILKGFAQASSALVVEADRDTAYGKVIELMDMARNSGISSIVMAAQRKDTKKKR